MTPPPRDQWREQARALVRPLAVFDQGTVEWIDTIDAIASALASVADESRREERERCRLIVSDALMENARGYGPRGGASSETKAANFALSVVIEKIKDDGMWRFGAAARAVVEGGGI